MRMCYTKIVKKSAKDKNMIKNRLKVLLAEMDLNYSKLHKMTGISVNALCQMGKKGGTGIKQITFENLDIICEALNCEIGDLLVRIPNQKRKTKKKKK